MSNTDKFGFVRRLVDGAILDIPLKDMESTLQRGGFEEIKDVGKVYENSAIEFPKDENTLECPLCGKVSKTESALQLHKQRSHK